MLFTSVQRLYRKSNMISVKEACLRVGSFFLFLINPMILTGIPLFQRKAHAATLVPTESVIQTEAPISPEIWSRGPAIHQDLQVFSAIKFETDVSPQAKHVVTTNDPLVVDAEQAEAQIGAQTAAVVQENSAPTPIIAVTAADIDNTIHHEEIASDEDPFSQSSNETVHSHRHSGSISTSGSSTSGTSLSANQAVLAAHLKPSSASDDYESDDEPFIYPYKDGDDDAVSNAWAPEDPNLSLTDSQAGSVQEAEVSGLDELTAGAIAKNGVCMLLSDHSFTSIDWIFCASTRQQPALRPRLVPFYYILCLQLLLGLRLQRRHLQPSLHPSLPPFHRSLHPPHQSHHLEFPPSRPKAVMPAPPMRCRPRKNQARELPYRHRRWPKLRPTSIFGERSQPEGVYKTRYGRLAIGRRRRFRVQALCKVGGSGTLY